MKIKRIRFHRLNNTRDLGGFPAGDGRKIVYGKLIRSGALEKADDTDIALLKDKYRLRRIVDFRTDAEREQAPDPKIPGVLYLPLPILDSSFFGIARDEDSIEAWMKLFADPSVAPEEVFKEMYRKLIFSEYVKPYYNEFFNCLLEEEDGAVLWHCSAGKDRAGIATMLVMMALGVDRNLMVRDYLMTERFQKKELRKLRLFISLFIKDKRRKQCLKTLLGVKEDYVRQFFDIIDKEYGNDLGYLERFLGISDLDIKRLRTMYLTEQ